MKFVFLIGAIFFSLTALAETKDLNFKSLVQRHGAMVNNDGETWLQAESTQHPSETELLDVPRTLVADAIWGVEGINMRPFDSKNPKQDLVALLTGGGYPFFCTTFEKDFEWTDDPKKCAENLSTLLGDVPDEADTITVIEMWGNFYGVWAETVVVFQNYLTKESLVLRFDLVHEI